MFDFRGIGSGGFGGYELTDQLLYNLKYFVDWGIVNNGGYNNHNLGTESFYENDESQLKLAIDERYPSGQVWEGIGREWVWESGVTAPSGGIDPINISGIYVNGVFYPRDTSGVYAHHIDYRHGRVIFDLPQSFDDTIQVEYSSRKVFVGFADSLEFQQLLLNALEEFLTDVTPSGTPSRDHQIWLPAIFIDLDRGKQEGLQLGGGQIKTRTVIFHVFADNPYDRNLLMDWLDYQTRKVFWTADLNAIPFPFDHYGDLESNVTNWLDLTSNYPWKKIRVTDGTVQKINSMNSKIFRAKVIWKVEIDIGNI
jgi:hypothetical protein